MSRFCRLKLLSRIMQSQTKLNSVGKSEDWLNVRAFLYSSRLMLFSAWKVVLNFVSMLVMNNLGAFHVRTKCFLLVFLHFISFPTLYMPWAIVCCLCELLIFWCQVLRSRINQVSRSKSDGQKTENIPRIMFFCPTNLPQSAFKLSSQPPTSTLNTPKTRPFTSFLAMSPSVTEYLCASSTPSPPSRLPAPLPFAVPLALLLKSISPNII